MYLAAPLCPNCGGSVAAERPEGAPDHWWCDVCDLVVLDTPKTATEVGAAAGEASERSSR